MGQARPVLVQQAAGTQPVLVQPAYRAEHTHGQLHASHFHREHGHGQTLLHGHMFADVQRKCRLTHRRTARHDDQVTDLHAAGHFVQVDEACGHAGHVSGGIAVVQLIDPLHHLRQQRLDFLEAFLAPRALFGNRKNLGFCLIKQFAHLAALRRESGRGNVVRHGDQLAQHRALAHDFRVAADIGRARRVLRQGVQVGQPTHLLGLAGNLEHFIHGDHVRRLGGGDQARNALEDEAVIEAVEVRFGEEVGNTVPGGIIQQQTAEYRLLGLDGVRGNLETV
ncbi:hypothetical protein D3C72_936950 [compost metagenome]